MTTMACLRFCAGQFTPFSQINYLGRQAFVLEKLLDSKVDHGLSSLGYISDLPLCEWIVAFSLVCMNHSNLDSFKKIHMLYGG